MMAKFDLWGVNVDMKINLDNYQINFKHIKASDTGVFFARFSGFW